LRNERDIMPSIDSHWVPRFFGHFQDAQHVYFCMEFVPGGELFMEMRNASGGKSRCLSVERAKFYAAEVLCCLEAVHAAGVVYRDLKPENVLIAASGHVKLTDFGFATRGDASGRCHTRLGTPHYQAPEMLDKHSHTGYTLVVDFWSWGILLYELLSGKTPFARGGDTPYEIYLRIMAGKLSFPSSLGPLGGDLLRGVLNFKLDARVTSPAAIKSHPLFAGLDWAAAAARRLEPPFVPNFEHPADLHYFQRFSASKGKDISLEDDAVFVDF
jgi:protein kinase X